MAKVRNDAEKFVEVYMSVFANGGNYADVGDLLGITADSVASKRSQWANRDKGKIVLPPLGGGTRGAKPLDTEALNAKIAALMSK